jgi:NAD(P) transhydrogenase subunit alpha
MSVRIVVAKEVLPGEQRVALTPEVAGKLVKGGVEVALESGAGTSAGYPDSEFQKVGATIVSDRASLLGSAAIVLGVQPPTVEEVGQMKPGTISITTLFANRNPEVVRKMGSGKVTSFALELLPRITRAQSMDVLSSQATLAGYQAVLIGASMSPRILPMLTTAAGTIRPSDVLILGAGVAGLMAIATARRLGGVVTAYDVRKAAGEQVKSLGAKFLELQINAEGQGGYARELTAEEKAMEQKMVSEAVCKADLVITTANVPGRKAPMLVSKETVSHMKPGAVIVDMAAESGGNCELTKPGGQVLVNGVTIVGPTNLPSQVSYHASQMFAKNLQSFLGLLIDKDGKLTTSYADEVLAASLVTKDGEIVNATVRDQLGGAK